MTLGNRFMYRHAWTPQVGESSHAGCRVIAPDLRGYGVSSVSSTISWNTFAHDIAAFLDYLRVG